MFVEDLGRFNRLIRI